MCVPLLDELKFLAVHGDLCHLNEALPEILNRTATEQGNVFDPTTYLSDVNPDPLSYHGHDSEWLDVIEKETLEEFVAWQDERMGAAGKDEKDSG